MRSAIERYFGVLERGSTVPREVVAGVTTFVTMAYILFVNPSILSALPDSTGFTPDRAAVLTSTALIAGFATIAMGLAARLPLALAPGMGLNAVVAFQLVASVHLTWKQAMGVIVAEGLVITLLVLTGFRKAVMNAIPLSLKRAIAVAIGLFLSLIGFVSAGFVTRHPSGPLPVKLGGAEGLLTPGIAVFVVGLLVTSALVVRRVNAGLLIGMAVTTVLAAILKLFYPKEWFPGVAELPDQWLSLPNFSQVGNFSFDFVTTMGWAAAAVTVFSIMLSDFFDTMGTVVAVGQQAGVVDRDGQVPRSQAILLVDSLAAVGGGALGASSATSYVESASGVAAGGRTGLTAVVTGVLFLLCLGFSPLAGIVPAQATGAVLVVVGFFMMQEVGEIPWREPVHAIPAFLTLAVMPFTYSITNGIGAGVISYTVLAVVSGKARSLHPLLWVCAVAFGIYFVLGAA